ncbi:MAG TPA: hypothetical protein VIJ79_17655 [Acidobacteriaceae bacterium]
MNPRLRADLKWLLILPVLAASMVAAMVALEFSIILDRPFITRAFALGINSSPPSLLRPLHLLVMLGIAFILVLPSALSVAFAGRVRPRVCLAWGFSIATLLTAAFVSFTAAASSLPAARWAAGVAVAIVVGGIVLARFGSQRYRTHALATTLGIAVLFIPSLAALAHPKKYPPEPQRVWSAVLQEETWQGMNTGSEYAATRQVVVAGDRVLAVFDAGSAGYEGNWPVSNYRLLSLDIATGTKKNEIDFPGRWGSMPYIYSAENSQIDVQSNPPRRLNPDLSPVGEAVSTAAAKTSGKEAATLKTPGRCEFNSQIPVTLPSWQFGCSTVRIVDSEGKLLTEQPVVGGFGGFAGESRDGSRFALVSSESEGDPSFLLYEHFTIYDGSTANAIAMVPIKNLPERQSWSAFSPDGKYFAVGNPNNLSLYRLP